MSRVGINLDEKQNVNCSVFVIALYSVLSGNSVLTMLTGRIQTFLFLGLFPLGRISSVALVQIITFLWMEGPGRCLRFHLCIIYNLHEREGRRNWQNFKKR